MYLLRFHNAIYSLIDRDHPNCVIYIILIQKLHTVENCLYQTLDTKYVRLPIIVNNKLCLAERSQLALQCDQSLCCCKEREEFNNGHTYSYECAVYNFLISPNNRTHLLLGVAFGRSFHLLCHCRVTKLSSQNLKASLLALRICNYSSLLLEREREREFWSLF